MVGALTLNPLGHIAGHDSAARLGVAGQSALQPSGSRTGQAVQSSQAVQAGSGGTPLKLTLAPVTGSTLLAAQDAGQLSEEEQKQVAELKKIDQQVRAHERAHAAVGGQYAGAPSYEYTRGPDGQLYATSGEVPIDLSPEADPEATLQKAEQVVAAALAPADPSAADRAVAAAAAKLRLEALAEIRTQKRAGREGQGGQDMAAPGAKIPSPETQSQDGVSSQPAPDSATPGQNPPAARAAQAYGNDNTARLGRLIGLIA
jgi:SprA-related family.